VAFGIAAASRAPLDLALVRKIGAPFEGKLAVGALGEVENPEVVTDPRPVASLDISSMSLKKSNAAEHQKIERRRLVYLGDHQPVDVAGRTAIFVDDGIAMDATIPATLRHRAGAGRPRRSGGFRADAEAVRPRPKTTASDWCSR
jgi:putative phosphoribosyl transferase